MVSCWIWSAAYIILEPGDSKVGGEGRGGTWLLSAGYTTRISRFIRLNVGWWEGRDGILLDLECRIHYTRVRRLKGWWEGRDGILLDLECRIHYTRVRRLKGWWEGREGILLDLECRIHYTRVRILIRSNVGWWEGSGRMGSGRIGLG